MRIVFFGTPDVAAVSLRALTQAFEVVAVVTQPDRPKGRSGTPTASPVKVLAAQANISVLQPESPKDETFAQHLSALEPDCFAVVAYGHLLPTNILAIPRKGTVNAHFSLLPKFRGAAPVQRAIMAGETQTGVSVFFLEPEFDTGPVIEQVVVPIHDDDTTGTLLDRLGPVASEALVRALNAIDHGGAQPVPQQDAQATPARKIKPEEALIDWSRSAFEIRNMIRAMNPAPGAYTLHNGKRLKIWSAALSHTTLPHAVIGPDMQIGTSEGSLLLLQVQPEGKKPMTFEEYARGARLQPGSMLGH